MHSKKVKCSYTPVIIQDFIPLQPCLVTKFGQQVIHSIMYILVFNFLPCACLSLAALLVAMVFAASSRSFLTRIKALILSVNAAMMLCTFDLPFFLSCLLASEVAISQYNSVVSDSFLKPFLILAWAVIFQFHSTEPCELPQVSNSWARFAAFGASLVSAATVQ